MRYLLVLLMISTMVYAINFEAHFQLLEKADTKDQKIIPLNSLWSELQKEIDVETQRIKKDKLPMAEKDFSKLQMLIGIQEDVERIQDPEFSPSDCPFILNRMDPESGTAPKYIAINKKIFSYFCR